MDGFTNILRAILRAMAANSFDNAPFKKREFVSRDKFNRLDGEAFVMVASLLVTESVGCHVMMLDDSR
jgi:hypothetical protein